MKLFGFRKQGGEGPEESSVCVSREGNANEEYDRRMRQQIAQYRDVQNIHDLPAIFHYWSNRYIRPRLNTVIGVDSVADFYTNAFLHVSKHCQDDLTLVSLGAGDCSVEVSVVQMLRNRGFERFTLECLEVSPVLIKRGEENIRFNDLTKYLSITAKDISDWKPKSESLHGIMAHHSLHHMVHLESIFNSIAEGLNPNGVFVTNDMIGRNGHMRWPEVKAWIDRLWPVLPDRLKYNHQLRRFEKEFLDWDCSGEGFEGIRAQDILPLLIDCFDLERFLPYGGLVDIFIDRGFGHNFRVDDELDRAIIDFIQFANDRLIANREIKPTMMFAEMKKKGLGKDWVTYDNWTPSYCVRVP